MDDDYVQTIDQDTIIYDSGWVTLSKVTGGSLNYTSDNNVFKSDASQQVRSQVYVNFVLEGGFTADGASEQEFVESIERYEATGSLTAKAAE